MYVLGLDPGKQGGIALVGKKRVYELHMTPLNKSGEYDIPAMSALLSEGRMTSSNTVAVIERQAARPIQGVKAAFNMGYGFGIWETLLLVHGIPFEVVKPQEWQKEMFKGLSKGEKKNTKSASAQIAQRLFPKTDFKRSSRCKNLHDGYTDATCIAVYGRRKIWR